MSREEEKDNGNATNNSNKPPAAGLLDLAVNAFNAFNTPKEPLPLNKPKDISAPISQPAAVKPIEEEKKELTLYDKFGGDAKMEAFIDDLAKVWINDDENSLLQEKYQDPERLSLFKEKLFHFFKYKMDGAKFYIGIPLSETHWQLGITDIMFDKAVAQVIATLRK